MYGSYVSKRPEQSVWDSARADLGLINQAVSRVRLRLNPNEKNKEEKEATDAVLKTLKEFEDLFANNPHDFIAILANISDRLLVAAQVVLKMNWDRVRSGELTYRITRFAALVIVVCAFIWLIFYMLK